MSTPPLDTDPAAWSAYEAVLARMDGPARVRVAIELSDAVRDIRLSGIESRHPELTREQAVARLILEEFGVTLPVAR
jgi:hypothetical protein